MIKKDDKQSITTMSIRNAEESSRLSGRKRTRGCSCYSNKWPCVGLKHATFKPSYCHLSCHIPGQVPVTCLNLEREILPRFRCPKSKEGLDCETLDSTVASFDSYLFFWNSNDRGADLARPTFQGPQMKFGRFPSPSYFF